MHTNEPGDFELLHHILNPPNPYLPEVVYTLEAGGWQEIGYAGMTIEVIVADFAAVLQRAILGIPAGFPLWYRPEQQRALPAGIRPNLQHARDIPDAAFLDVIEIAGGPRGQWVMVHEVCAELERRGFRAAAMRSGQPQDIVPAKIVRAKAARLIERGLMDGCTCGCRGDFELTDAGRAYLADHPREN